MCVCEDISKSPGAREIGGRDGLLKKKQKKQKKRGKETTNREEKIHARERQHTFNTISTTDTKKNVYEENSGGIAVVIILL